MFVLEPDGALNHQGIKEKRAPDVFFFFPASHFACSWVQTRRKQERSRITHPVVGVHTKFSLKEVLTFSEGNCCKDVLVKVNVRLLRWKVFLLSVQPGLIVFQLHASVWTLLSSRWHMGHRASPTELEGLFCHKANVFYSLHSPRLSLPAIFHTIASLLKSSTSSCIFHSC